MARVQSVVHDFMILNIFTDGASRSNPGKSASGFAVYDDSNILLMKKSFFNGIRTNNEAEYLAIIASLESVYEEYGHENVEIRLHSDSRLAINQLRGDYKVKDPKIKQLYNEALLCIGKFDKVMLINVPRENKNIVAVDSDLNQLLDKY